jgi:hypothetical protein
MNSKLIEVNVNSTLDAILNGKPDGDTKQFIFEDHGNNKTVQIAHTAIELGKSLGVVVYTSVNIPYASRSKRIEIVFIYQDVVFLSKITNSSKWDAAAIDLQDVISAYIKSTNFSAINGLVLVEGGFNQTDAENFVKEHTNHVIIQPILGNISGFLHGISDKSSTGRKSTVPS